MKTFGKEQEVLKETALWEKEDLEKMEQHRGKDEEVRDKDSGYTLADTYENDSDQILYSTPIQNKNDSRNMEKSEMPSPIHFHSTDTVLSTSTDESMVDPIAHARLPGAKLVMPKISKKSEMPSPIHFHSTDTVLSTSTDESMVDPIARARLPGAKLVMPKISKAAIPFVDDPEQMTFSEKKRRFELVTKPLSDEPITTDLKQFSFLSQAELERMREEEERKLASMSEKELKEYHSLEDEDLNEIIDNNLFHTRNVSLVDGLTTQQGFTSEQIKSIPNLEFDVEQRLNDKLNQNALDETLSSSQLRALHVAKQMARQQDRSVSSEEDSIPAQNTNMNEVSESICIVNFEDSEGIPSQRTKLT